ncbi:MAG: hypothetical protein IKP88_21510 [Lachnospiraceae bacterium]|nr:hypothetical protein [Lachnospiraceae bacterium]
MDRLDYNEKTEKGQDRAVKKHSSLAITIIIICAIGIIGILLYRYFKTNKTYDLKVISTVEISSQDKYERYGDGYIRYSTDGAEAVKDGRAIWNISYNMKKPIVDVCGSYCAFADKGQQTLCITDGQGGNFPINVPEKIVDISVASQGVTAVWTDSLAKDHIYVYDINGVLLIDIETSIATDGFPISIDLSDDGQKLVTSYMMIGDELTSWVTFYNFGNVGQNYAGKIVGSYSFKGKIIPEVKFVTNDRVCAFGEDGCILYRMKQVSSELAVQETTRLAAVCSDSEVICLAESETDGTNKIIIFDTDGKEKPTIVTGLSFSGMYVEGEELILYNNSSIIIYNLDGKEKCRTKLDGGIRSVFPVGSGKYCVFGGSEVRILETVEETDENE